MSLSKVFGEWSIQKSIAGCGGVLIIDYTHFVRYYISHGSLEKVEKMYYPLVERGIFSTREFSKYSLTDQAPIIFNNAVRRGCMYGREIPNMFNIGRRDETKLLEVLVWLKGKLSHHNVDIVLEPKFLEREGNIKQKSNRAKIVGKLASTTVYSVSPTNIKIALIAIEKYIENNTTDGVAVIPPGRVLCDANGTKDARAYNAVIHKLVSNGYIQTSTTSDGKKTKTIITPKGYRALLR